MNALVFSAYHPSTRHTYRVESQPVQWPRHVHQVHLNADSRHDDQAWVGSTHKIKEKPCQLDALLSFLFARSFCTYTRHKLAFHHHAHRHAQTERVPVHSHLPVSLRLIPVFKTMLNWMKCRGSRFVTHTPQSMPHGIMHSRLWMQSRMCICLCAWKVRRRHNGHRWPTF